MLCVARAKVGPLGRTWWAVWDGERLHEGTRGVSVSTTGATVRDGDTRLELALDARPPIEVTTGPAWTRKTPLRVTGSALVGGRTIALDSPGLLDESAGRHARRTAWRWSAGAGVAAVGRAVVWNLVEGLHDGDPSERTVWVDGEPHALAALPFDGLDGVGDLRFTRAGRRAPSARTTSSSPPTTSSPSAPSPARCRSRARCTGWGVMERHERALVILAARRARRGDRGRGGAARPRPGGAGRARRSGAAARRRRAVVGRRDRRGAGARADAGRARVAARARRRVRAGGRVRRARGAARGAARAGRARGC